MENRLLKKLEEYKDYIYDNDIQQLCNLEEEGEMSCCDKAEYEVLFNVHKVLTSMINAEKKAIIDDGEKAEVVTKLPELILKDYKGYEVCIRPSDNYGYFDSNSDDEYDYVEGGLWFEGDELVDFDGCSILPEEVGEAIIKLGYVCDISHFCR